MLTAEISRPMIPADEVKVAVGCRITASDKMKREAEAKSKGYKNITQYLEAILTGKENICVKDETTASVNLKEEDFDTIEQRVSLLLEERTEPLSTALSELKEMYSTGKEEGTTVPALKVVDEQLQKLYKALNVLEPVQKQISEELKKSKPEILNIQKLLFGEPVAPEVKTVSVKDAKQEEENAKLKKENERLTKELSSITENKNLKALFEEYKGKQMQYQSASGEQKQIAVNNISDVVTALADAANTSND